MNISRSLKLVIPVYDGDEVKIYIHSEPISRLAFENSYKIFARAWTDLSASNISSSAMMPVAAVALKDAAISLYGNRDGDIKYNALMSEILRGTTAIIPDNGSYTPTPLENLVSAGKIDDEDYATIESLLAFFTLGCRMVDPKWATILKAALKMNYSADYISSNCMEYLNSLRTPTTNVDTTKNQTV